MGYLTRKLSVEEIINAQNTEIKTKNLRPGVNEPLIPQAKLDNQIAVLKKMGFTNGEQVEYFNAEIEANPQLKKMFADFEKDFAKSKKYDAVLASIGRQVIADGQRIDFDTNEAKKSGTGIIDRLARDLNGSNGPDIIKQLRNNPDTISSKIDDYAAGKIGVAAMLAQPLVQEEQPKRPTPVATGSAKTSTTAQVARAPTKAKPASTDGDIARPSIAVAAADITVAPSNARAPTGAQPTATAVPDAAPLPEQAANAPLRPPSGDPTIEVLDSLASLSNEDMRKQLKRDDVRLILNGMADIASSKFGVEAGVADAFKKRMENDPELLNNITTNFRNNPEFIRQLAKASKDSGEPLSDAKKNGARAMMTPIMENPQNLAEDSYVKEMTGKLKLGNSKSPLMDMFAGMFGGLGGWLGQLMEGFKRFFSGFFGDKKVFSVVSQGGSMLPSLMVNPRAIEENRLKYDTEAGVSARSMTALSLDGKRFITVKEKGSDGKEIEKQVPNTIEITTIDGKKVKVVPAVGVLLAQQAKGDYDPDTGRWVAGPVNAWVVTGLNEAGGSSAVKRVTMSETEFLKFKKRVDEISVKDGDGRQLAFQNYTEQDARKAGIVPRIQVASVNPQTGAVTDTVLRPTAQPASPAPAGPQSYPVRPGGTDAANDPELALKA